MFKLLVKIVEKGEKETMLKVKKEKTEDIFRRCKYILKFFKLLTLLKKNWLKKIQKESIYSILKKENKWNGNGKRGIREWQKNMDFYKLVGKVE